MNNTSIKTLLGGLALSVAGLASATTTYDIQYQSTTGDTVPTSAADAYGGSMSYLSSTGTSFAAFCIELAQDNATTASGYQTYTVSSLSSSTTSLLEDLFSSTYASLSSATEYAAFQTAIWEITHETDTSSALSILSGSFTYTGDDASFAALVNSYLSSALSYTGSSLYTITVLSSATYQDLVTVSAVPEPSTYALMAAGLAAISLARRRRKSS
jgi:PEP-CTERM motif/Thioester domain